jgi:hypothetical protein
VLTVAGLSGSLGGQKADFPTKAIKQRADFDRKNLEVIDFKGDVGKYCSLAVDDYGWAHVSYYDASRNCLKYARWMGNAWDIQVVDTRGDVAKYTAIAVDSTGQPSIKYCDESGPKIKSMQWQGNGWVPGSQAISSGPIPLIDRHASAALDSNGIGHYVYYDSNGGDLIYTKGTQGPPRIEENKMMPMFSGNTTNFISQSMVACDVDTDHRKELIVDFGPPWGLWILANNTKPWQSFHPCSARTMVAGDFDNDPAHKEDIAVDFGRPWGIWVFYNGFQWTPNAIHPATAISMVAGDFDSTRAGDELIVDFGSYYGIWVWSQGAWDVSPIHTGTAKFMTVGNVDWTLGGGFIQTPEVDLVVDFGYPYGIFMWHPPATGGGSAWHQLHPSTSKAILIADWNLDGLDDIFIDFAAGFGVWVADNGAFPPNWYRLTYSTTEGMAIGFVFGALYRSLFLNLGQVRDPADYWSGIVEIRNHNAADWIRLHSVPPKLMLCADLDNSGRDELICDWGSYYGIYCHYNNSTWDLLIAATSK